MTMEVIQHQQIGAGGAASITFSSIPQTYTDLVIVFSGRADRANYYDNIRIMPNGATTGVSSRVLYGTGSGVGSLTEAYITGYTGSSTATANTFGNSSIYIPNYTSSNQKSFSIDSVSENNATAGFQAISAGLWTGTTAITSITLDQGDGSNWQAYTSATLYGVTKFVPSASAKATGGTITYDASSSSWVHTFTSSGTFTPTTNLTDVEYLVIAGGGGGGGYSGGRGGGGGAGGYRSSAIGELSGGGASTESRLSLNAGTGYTVTIGAGGTSQVQGNTTSFHTITTVGGGYGATSINDSGHPGGSGGGAGGTNGGGAGTANQGYNGSGGIYNLGGSQVKSGTGGGGAGGNGTDGNGGAGVQSAISGTLTYRAGGGGGAGTGGAYGGGVGGGGAGNGFTGNGGTGTVNTGGGGGAAGYAGYQGGTGGSGIVIVRYKA